MILIAGELLAFANTVMTSMLSVDLQNVLAVAVLNSKVTSAVYLVTKSTKIMKPSGKLKRNASNVGKEFESIICL